MSKAGISMKRALQIPAVVLTFAFGAATMFAQGRGFNGGDQNNATASHPSAHQAKTASHPAPAASFKSNPAQNHYTGGERGIGPSTPYVNPFQQQVHLTGAGAGCATCGYATYGGYAYGGSGGGHSSANPDGYNTASDQILKNGGTFNNVNAGNQLNNPPPNTFDTNVSYMHAQYQAQEFYDNGGVGQSAGGQQIASAASETPAILVFKDGHQVTVQNYAIYGAFVVVMSPEEHKYPIASLDVDATQKANLAAGYDLHLPAVFTGK